MYRILFENQVAQGSPDYIYDPIYLTEADYDNLPVLDYDKFFDKDCVFKMVSFREPIRHEPRRFSAIRVENDKWNSDRYELMDPRVVWYFVCLNGRKNVWIAFKYWDEATLDDTMHATVGVSFPRHGDVYRLDDKCKIVIEALVML